MEQLILDFTPYLILLLLVVILPIAFAQLAVREDNIKYIAIYNITMNIVVLALITYLLWVLGDLKHLEDVAFRTLAYATLFYNLAVAIFASKGKQDD